MSRLTGSMSWSGGCVLVGTEALPLHSHPPQAPAAARTLAQSLALTWVTTHTDGSPRREVFTVDRSGCDGDLLCPRSWPITEMRLGRYPDTAHERIVREVLGVRAVR